MLHTDQTGFTINLPETPRRIISLVPSQSEYLWDLGLEHELVGITKFCIHPDDMFRTVERVGGTKQLNLAAISKLNPHLIIGNREENTKEQIEILREQFPVWLSDVNTLDDAIGMMEQIAMMTGRQSRGEQIIHAAKTSLQACKGMFKGLKAVYFIWQEPFMLAGAGTFIHSVMEHVGFQNQLGGRKRYPVLTVEELKALKPEYCLLSTEPFPFSQKHVAEMQALLPGSKVVLADGELFSWYGSRLRLLHQGMQVLQKEFSSIG